MIRLKREQYAVGEVEHPNGLSVTVGIFYDTPIHEDIEELTYTAQGFARTALDVWGGNHVGVSESVQDVMDREYPGRPFYVETRESGRGVQVYQPYGMPQDTEPSNYGEGGVGKGSQAQVPKRLGRLPDHES